MFKDNPTSERALLNACSKDINSFYFISSLLEADDFQAAPNAVIYTLMKELADSGVTKLSFDHIFSLVTQRSLLEGLKGMDRVTYLKAVLDNRMAISTHINDIKKHIKVIKEISNAHKLKALFEQKTKSLNRGNIDKIIDETITALLFLNNGINNDTDPVSNTDAAEERLAGLSCPPVSMSGLSTGYPILDKHINGLLPSSLTVIAADKKAGKSAFLTNITKHVAYNLNIPVLYIDTEMRSVDWYKRLHACVSDLPERKINNYQLNDVEKGKLAALMEKDINTRRIYHMYMPGYTVDKVVALVNRYYRSNNIGLVVFDYIKEPEGSSTNSSRREYQILGDVTTKLKNLAGTLNIPILTAAQLNRTGNIGDSYKISQYADVLCSWARREHEEHAAGGPCGDHKLWIMDSRRGGNTDKGGIGYNFYMDTLTIKEVPTDNQYYLNKGWTYDDSNKLT